MDQTSLLRTHRGNSRRSDKKQSAAGGREASLTPPAACPVAPSQEPGCRPRECTLLVLLASRSRAWQQTVFIIQPATLLPWHGAGFQLVWRKKSGAASQQPKLPRETVALIQQMARESPHWGAERIRGELLTLGLRVCKRMIQRYMRSVRKAHPTSQAWFTFLRTHADVHSMVINSAGQTECPSV